MYGELSMLGARVLEQEIMTVEVAVGHAGSNSRGGGFRGMGR